MAEKQYTFSVRMNDRKCCAVSHKGHISKEDLETALQDPTIVEKIMDDCKKLKPNYELKIRDYLSWNIPNYPTPVEFHISEVSHATHIDAFKGILESEGFRAYGDDLKLSWWSLKIDAECIKAAEEHYLENELPNRSQEQKESQEAFLSKFTTSPAFHIDESRYGNFRFIYSLKKLMKAYKEQMCEGQDPVLREYKTTFYLKEIMYTVLIHSPDDNERFEDYSMIEESKFVDYRNNQIVWKAQAICEDFKFELILDKENKTANVEPVSKNTFYVWDHVCLAFHFDDVLEFSKETLLKGCIPCKPAAKITGRSDRCSYEDAKKILKSELKAVTRS